MQQRFVIYDQRKVRGLEALFFFVGSIYYPKVLTASLPQLLVGQLNGTVNGNKSHFDAVMLVTFHSFLRALYFWN